MKSPVLTVFRWVGRVFFYGSVIAIGIQFNLILALLLFGMLFGNSLLTATLLVEHDLNYHQKK